VEASGRPANPPLQLGSESPDLLRAWLFDRSWQPPWLKVEWEKKGDSAIADPMVLIRKVKRQRKLAKAAGEGSGLASPIAGGLSWRSFEGQNGKPRRFLMRWATIRYLRASQTNLLQCFPTKPGEWSFNQWVQGSCIRRVP